MRKLFIILIIIGVLIVSSGCVQYDDEQKSTQIKPVEYLSSTKLIRYNISGNSEINPKKQFDSELKEFHDFTMIFFPIWNEHIESTAPILEKFNSAGTNLEDKIIYSKLLAEKYEIFRDKVIKITPPVVTSKAYQYSLNTISQRILFFNEFEKGTSISTLIEIENEAYLYEVLFWEEIDKIYNLYLEEIDKKNIIRI